MMPSVDATTESRIRPARLGSFLDFYVFGAVVRRSGWWKGSREGAGCRVGIVGLDRETPLSSRPRQNTYTYYSTDFLIVNT